jgi:hypothetical protein
LVASLVEEVQSGSRALIACREKPIEAPAARRYIAPMARTIGILRITAPAL